jgi:hypothetical protein
LPEPPPPLPPPPPAPPPDPKGLPRSVKFSVVPAAAVTGGVIVSVDFQQPPGEFGVAGVAEGDGKGWWCWGWWGLKPNPAVATSVGAEVIMLGLWAKGSVMSVLDTATLLPHYGGARRVATNTTRS